MNVGFPSPVTTPELPAPRILVTGHDDAGRAVLIADGPPRRSVALEAVPGTVFHEVWSTRESPARVDAAPEGPDASFALAPPPGGSRVRIVDIPPDSVQAALSPDEVASAFAEIGAPEAGTGGDRAPHPLMHRTDTVDYGIVLVGEVWLVVDEGETRLSPGDVVIQRGTNHAWSNRTDAVARMAFVLLDGVR